VRDMFVEETILLG